MTHARAVRARWYSPRMLGGPIPARPARPVADAPLSALAGSDVLAKGWLLTLIAQAPLAAAAALPAGELAQDAPALCAAMTGALAADADLDRLRPGGDLERLASRAGRLAGAADAAGAAGAIGALRAVLWGELLEALRRPDPEVVAALAARLGLVCDVVAAAALSGARQPAPATGAPAAEALEPRPAPGARARARAQPAPRAGPRPACARRPRPGPGSRGRLPVGRVDGGPL